MSKKIISILSVLFLLISSVPCVSMAENTTDTDSFHFSELGNEYDLLKELGIITSEESEFANAKITRGEFASYAVRSLNIANTTSVNQYFTDVPANHPYFGEIGMLAQMGILKGTSPSTFSPDSEITIAQVACASLRMINMHWATEGVSMNQIVSTAISKDLLVGLDSQDYNSPAHRADVYIILYNVLQCSMYVNTSYGEEPNYELSKDTTILSEYWHLKKANGLVTADYNGAIEGVRTDAKNEIIVGGERFYTSTETCVNQLGKKIEFFYREEGNKKTIVFATAPHSKVVVLKAGDFEFDYLKGVYSVYTDGRDIKFKIGDSYYLSYNGDAVLGSDKELMNPSFGTVTLIDNGDGVYSVIMAEEYYTIVLDYYDPYTSTLVDINDSTRNVTIDDYKNVDINIETEKLEKNNVVNVYASPSKECIKIIVSSNPVSGKVMAVSYENGYMSVTTEDKTLSMSGDTRFDTSIIEAGSFYTFYTDNFGSVVYATSGSSLFGVVLTYSNESGISNKKCYVLSKDGTKQSYDLAKTVNVRTPNGTSAVSAKDLEDNVPRHTVVMYEVNSNGQIREFTLAAVIETEEEYNNLPTYPFFRVDYFLNEWPMDVGGSNQFRREITGFGNWLILDKATVMQVPTLPNNDYNDENTSAYDITEFQDDYEVVINSESTSVKEDGEIEVYQFANDGLTPSVLLVHGGPSNDNIPLSGEAKPYIVTKISSAYDEESTQALTRLELMDSKGVLTSAFVKDNSLTEREYLLSSAFGTNLPQLDPDKTSLAVGDVVQISKNPYDGKISKLALMYDSENKLLSYTKLSNFDIIYRMVSGEVLASSNSFMAFKTPNGRIERTTIGSASVIVVNKLKNGKLEFKYGKQSDIKPGDTIAMYARYVNNNIIYVYKY